jgi:protein-S-isoprenylcysteine O-methyltransferase
MTQRILLIVVALFPVSEVGLALVKRSRRGSVQAEDRGSMSLIWLSVGLGLALAIAAQGLASTRLSASPSVVRPVALVLLVGGLVVRWAAILTLGRLFTVDIAIHSDHVVVQSGLYRFVRHPSYTGLLVAFLGLGFFFANWLSIVGLFVPIAAAVLNRVAKEERALLESLGDPYAAYCARTKRFIPWVL